MRSYKIFILSFLTVLFTFTETRATTMNNPWFNKTECSLLEIKRLKSISDRQVIHSIKIEDAHAINNLMQRISKISANGREMINFGPDAEEIDLTFHCANQVQKISIFEKKFQTPSTGFNEEKSKLEESLYNDIDALLFPDFNKRILKIENLPLTFKGFTVIYKGSIFKDHSPASVQTATQKFMFEDKNSQQLVEVISGQMPPQPQSVSLRINRIIPTTSKIKVLTYKTDQGIELYPDYFQITK